MPPEASDLDALDEDWLGCAAYLGHPQARSRLGPEAPDEPEDLRDWVLGLDTWGDEIAVRSLLALAGLRRAQGLPLPPNAVPAAEGLVNCPCAKHEHKARLAWADNAVWASEVDWAEIAAEHAWETSHQTSEQAVREAIRVALLAWVLTQGPPDAEAATNPPA